MTTSKSDIDSLLIGIDRILVEEIVRTFAFVGEQCIKRIRDRNGEDSWFDQTGNLRSSIGYGVYNHGKSVLESAFNVVKSGVEGPAKGEQLLNELASKYAETYALVVVAGMEYADYVEAMEKKDVLASTHLWAKGQMQFYLSKALDRASERIKRLSA